MPSKKVTKSDLVEAVYQNSDYEKKCIQDVLEHLLGQLKESLKDGNVIELRGFGTFEPTQLLSISIVPASTATAMSIPAPAIIMIVFHGILAIASF